MNFSLFRTKQVDCWRGGECNKNRTQYGDWHYPLAMDDLHNGVVGCVDKQVPNEYIQDVRGNTGSHNGSKDNENHVEAGHN